MSCYTEKCEIRAHSGGYTIYTGYDLTVSDEIVVTYDAVYNEDDEDGDTIHNVVMERPEDPEDERPDDPFDEEGDYPTDDNTVQIIKEEPEEPAPEPPATVEPPQPEEPEEPVIEPPVQAEPEEEEPPEPDEEVDAEWDPYPAPETGDRTDLALFLITSLTAAAAVIVLAIYRKKEEEDEQ